MQVPHHGFSTVEEVGEQLVKIKVELPGGCGHAATLFAQLLKLQLLSAAVHLHVTTKVVLGLTITGDSHGMSFSSPEVG
jgi:hypothetical protein